MPAVSQAPFPGKGANVYADELTREQKHTYMRYAIIATCFGSVIQIALSESSLFLLYASSIGAGKFLSLVTSSFIHLMNFFLLMPMAYLMEKYGIKRIMIPCYLIGMTAMLAASAAGFFRPHGLVLFTAGVSIYAVSITVHSAGWFSLLRFIVPAERRGAFFGRIRFAWQWIIVFFFLLTALFVGRDAPVVRLQAVIAAGTLLIIGRAVFVSRIPERRLRRRVAPFRVMLFSALKNKKLAGYSFCMFTMNFLITSAVPLGFAYLKYEIMVTDQMMVLFSMFSNTSMIIGFYAAGKIIDRLPLRTLLKPVQFGFFTVFAVFFTLSMSGYDLTALAVVLICASAALYAFSTVIVSAKMMGLVKENNVNISMAFAVGVSSGGLGLSRFFSSVVVDRYPEGLEMFGTAVSAFQGLFLLFAFGLLLFTAVPYFAEGMRTRKKTVLKQVP